VSTERASIGASGGCMASFMARITQDLAPDNTGHWFWVHRTGATQPHLRRLLKNL
jgi:hypothetical protein